MKTPTRSSKYNPEESRRFNTKCVCQICTCGTHKCPKARGARFDGQTTNHHDYKPYKIATPRQIAKHQLREKHYDPDLIKSSYDINFRPHKIVPENPQKKYEYKTKNTPFDDRTEYKQSYVGKKIAPQPVWPNRRQIPYNPNKTHFEGITTYNTEFTPKKGEIKNLTPRNYEKKTTAFRGQTTYNAEFIPKKSEINLNRTIDYLKTSSYRPRKTKFQGESSYKEDYRGHIIKTQQKCPILILPTYPRQCSPGKNHLNYSLEKNSWD